MLQLLRQLPANEQTDYIQTLQHTFPDELQAASFALVEPLSPRELEVLRLIAAELSNKQNHGRADRLAEHGQEAHNTYLRQVGG